MGIKNRLSDLFKTHNTPHEIALGVAVGVFIGFTPLYGLHLFIVLLFALIIPDMNKIAMLIGANSLSRPLYRLLAGRIIA